MIYERAKAAYIKAQREKEEREDGQLSFFFLYPFIGSLDWWERGGGGGRDLVAAALLAAAKAFSVAIVTAVADTTSRSLAQAGADAAAVGGAAIGGRGNAERHQRLWCGDGAVYNP